MRGVNKVILLGNATRDAELRQTQSGKAVSSLRVATNRHIGEREETQYHTVICWERLAETTHRFVKKGDPLYIEGRLSYRRFQASDGQEHGVVEIIASDVQFLGKRADSTTSTAATSAQRDPDVAPSDSTPLDEVSPDEIPF